MIRNAILMLLTICTGCTNEIQVPTEPKSWSISSTVSQTVEKFNTYNVGNNNINIPLLSNEFHFVDDDYRSFLEVYVAPTNELICGFLLNEEKYIFETGSDDFLTQYATIQYAKDQAYFDVSENDFLRVADQMGDFMGGDISEVTESTQELLNERLNDLDLSSLNIDFGNPIPIGTLIKRKDVCGFGMIMPYEMKSVKIKKCMIALLMRVNKRLIFIYIYDDYKGKSTIKKLVDLAGNYSDMIKSIN